LFGRFRCLTCDSGKIEAFVDSVKIKKFKN